MLFNLPSGLVENLEHRLLTLCTSIVWRSEAGFLKSYHTVGVDMEKSIRMGARDSHTQISLREDADVPRVVVVREMYGLKCRQSNQHNQASLVGDQGVDSCSH